MPSSIFYTSFNFIHNSEGSLSPLELEKLKSDAERTDHDPLLSTVLALFRNPSAIITLNPLVTSHHSLDPAELPPETRSHSPSSVPWQGYSVTDTKAGFFNIGSNTVTYKAWFRETASGCETVVAAPAGVAIEAAWIAEEIHDVGEDEAHQAKGGTSIKVTETAKVTCPRIFAPYIRSTMSESHGVIHKRLWERCKETLGLAGS